MAALGDDDIDIYEGRIEDSTFADYKSCKQNLGRELNSDLIICVLVGPSSRVEQTTIDPLQMDQKVQSAFAMLPNKEVQSSTVSPTPS